MKFRHQHYNDEITSQSAIAECKEIARRSIEIKLKSEENSQSASAPFSELPADKIADFMVETLVAEIKRRYGPAVDFATFLKVTMFENKSEGVKLFYFVHGLW